MAFSFQDLGDPETFPSESAAYAAEIGITSPPGDLDEKYDTEVHQAADLALWAVVAEIEANGGQL